MKQMFGFLTYVIHSLCTVTYLDNLLTSQMDISNIYLKNESFEIFSQDWVKIGWFRNKQRN